MKDVKWAIGKVEQQIEKANAFIVRYEEKIRMVQQEIDYGPEEDREWLEYKKYAHYGRIYNANEYLEELGEVLRVLRTLNCSDRVVWAREEKLEETFGILEDMDIGILYEEMSNTVASITECKHSTKNSSTWVICISKTMKDL